jgi:EpsI family protein
MHKRTPNYWLVALLTLAAAYAGNRVAQIAPAAKVSANLDKLPMKLGTWQGEDIKLDATVMKALAADQVLCRQYTDSKTERALGLLVVYRKYGRRDFAHRPELCYPASGWEIVGKSYTSVPYGGRSVQARLVIAEQDMSREAVTYWFASGDRTEGNFAKQQLWMALDRLQKQKHGWAFIRVNVPEMYGDEEALELTRSFMKVAEGPLKESLTGGK